MYTWQTSSQIHLRDSQLRVIFRKAALDMRQYKQQVKKKLQSLCLKKSLQTILSKILPSAHHPQFMAAIPTKKTPVCVSKNRGTPKWMVYNGKPHLNGDLGVSPFSETSRLIASHFTSCWGSGFFTSSTAPSYQIWWSRWSYWNSRSSTLCRPSRCPENKSRGFPQSWKGGKM